VRLRRTPLGECAARCRIENLDADVTPVRPRPGVPGFELAPWSDLRHTVCFRRRVRLRCPWDGFLRSSASDNCFLIASGDRISFWHHVILLRCEVRQDRSCCVLSRTILSPAGATCRVLSVARGIREVARLTPKLGAAVKAVALESPNRSQADRNSTLTTGTPRPKDVSNCRAGLLARGLSPLPSLPDADCVSDNHRQRLAAYSCGGSAGVARRRTGFPLSSGSRTNPENHDPCYVQIEGATFNSFRGEQIYEERPDECVFQKGELSWRTCRDREWTSYLAQHSVAVLAESASGHLGPWHHIAATAACPFGSNAAACEEGQFLN
jgi:hypothetical protein